MVQVPVSYRWLATLSAARTPAGKAVRKTAVAVTGISAVLLAANVASAHIELTEPIARYEVQGETGIKGCPCGIATGGGGSNRTCNVEMDGSDPNRDEGRAFTAEAGSTVVLKFKETVGHVGKYRVAFDPEGADFNDFNDHVLTEVDDPNGSMGNVQNGNNWEIEVTLPETPCTNCTLQLVQVMDGSTLGNTVDGSKLASMSTYYACIDLVLTGEQGSTAGEGSESVAVSTGDVGASGSSAELVSSGDATSSADVAPTTPIPPPPVTPPTATPPVTPVVTATGVTPITPAPPPGSTPVVTPTTAPSTPPTGSTTDAPPAPGAPAIEASGCTVAGVGKHQTSAFWAVLSIAIGLGWLRRRAG